MLQGFMYDRIWIMHHSVYRSCSLKIDTSDCSTTRVSVVTLDWFVGYFLKRNAEYIAVYAELKLLAFFRFTIQ